MKVYRTVHEVIREAKIGSVLGPGSHSYGDIKCLSGLKVDGRHTGSVVIDGQLDAVVWVSASAVVKGDIYAPMVYIDGTVQGDVYADLIVLMPKGVMDGDAHCIDIINTKNGIFRGRTLKLTAQGDYKERLLVGRVKRSLETSNHDRADLPMDPSLSQGIRHG